MNSASLREKMPTCFWPPVLVFFKADSCLEFKTFVVKDDLYFVKFLISLNTLQYLYTYTSPEDPNFSSEIELGQHIL